MLEARRIGWRFGGFGQLRTDLGFGLRPKSDINQRQPFLFAEDCHAKLGRLAGF